MTGDCPATAATAAAAASAASAAPAAATQAWDFRSPFSRLGSVNCRIY